MELQAVKEDHMTKKLITRRDLLVAMAAALALPSTAYASAEPYSWYGNSFTLASGTWTTPVRYFDGNNIGIEMNCSAARKGNFTVTCCRSNGATIGVKYFSYQGFTKATWPSAGPGNYYFKLSKVDDGVRVSSSDVAMYSW